MIGETAHSKWKVGDLVTLSAAGKKSQQNHDVMTGFGLVVFNNVEPPASMSLRQCPRLSRRAKGGPTREGSYMIPLEQ